MNIRAILVFCVLVAGLALVPSHTAAQKKSKTKKQKAFDIEGLIAESLELASKLVADRGCRTFKPIPVNSTDEWKPLGIASEEQLKQFIERLEKSKPQIAKGNEFKKPEVNFKNQIVLVWPCVSSASSPPKVIVSPIQDKAIKIHISSTVAEKDGESHHLSFFILDKSAADQININETIRYIHEPNGSRNKTTRLKMPKSK